MTQKARVGLFFLALISASLALGPATVPAKAADAGAATTSGPSLYKRLGGYDAIAAVTDDFIARLAHDPKLSKFFGGVSQAHAARIRQGVVDLICYATGGPCFYVGEDLKKAHAGLGITDADFDQSAKDFVASLNKFNVPAAEQKELLDIVGKTRSDVVVPASAGHM